jgi:hypothetical protein
MSKQTLQNLQEAIIAHANDIYEDQGPLVLTDWFVAFGALKADDSNKVAYVTSDSSIQGSYGIGRLGLKILEHDFSFGNINDDD